jgi:hypothetical protein
MQANYPIYTTYHHVSVDVVDKKTVVDIEPWLLFQMNCTSCQSQSCFENSTVDSSNVTIIEENENHMVLLITEETNGTIIEYILDKTLLWTNNESNDEANRTSTFVSTIVTKGNESVQGYGLYSEVLHTDYNLTISTILNPLDVERYNTSLTTIDYKPFEEKEIITAEKINFNSSVTLSQLYASLGKTAKKLGKAYAKSEDTRLQLFEERYYTIAEETKRISKLVEKQIPEYNKQILKNEATILDNSWLCDWCPILCPIVVAGIGASCAALCWFTFGSVCAICVKYFDVIMWFLDSGCMIICDQICQLDQEESPSWLVSITYTGGSGSYAVDNPSYLLGPNSDSQFAHLHASNYGDCAQIFGELSEESTGTIYIYGCSGSGGYYSDLYVYVSDDGINWSWINTIFAITETTPFAINIGPASAINYIAIAGYDCGNSVCLYLDAVSVYP